MREVALKRGDEIVVPRCRVAASFGPRFVGLMGKRGIVAEEGMIFPRCNSIHTFFMRFPIDVILVSADGHVVDTIESMAPWRLLLPRFRAKHTIELQAGKIRAMDIRQGQQLTYEGAWR